MYIPNNISIDANSDVTLMPHIALVDCAEFWISCCFVFVTSKLGRNHFNLFQSIKRRCVRSGEWKISKKWADPKLQICLKLSKIRDIWFVEKPNIIMSISVHLSVIREVRILHTAGQGLAPGELGRKYSRLPITVFKSSVLYYYTRVHWPGGKWCEKKDWVGLALHFCLPNVRTMM